MPWTTTTPDITGYHALNALNTNWGGWMDSAGSLQIWETDQDPTAFLIKSKNSSSNEKIWCVHMPESWYYQTPNIVPNYDTSHAPCWYLFGTYGTFNGTIPTSTFGNLLCGMPPYYPKKMDDETFLTNYIQMYVTSGGIRGVFYGSQNDIVWRNPKKDASVNITDWQAISYKGSNYIDGGYTYTSDGILFNTGSASPITGL